MICERRGLMRGFLSVAAVFSNTAQARKDVQRPAPPQSMRQIKAKML